MTKAKALQLVYQLAHRQLEDHKIYNVEECQTALKMMREQLTNFIREASAELDVTYHIISGTQKWSRTIEIETTDPIKAFLLSLKIMSSKDFPSPPLIKDDV